MGEFRTWLEAAGGDLRQKLLALRPQLAAAAQAEYDEWDASDPEAGDAEVGWGGICDRIADRMVDVLSDAGIESRASDHVGSGENHYWAFAWDDQDAFVVDIPPGVYETGGGYTWKKIPGVRFTPAHIVIEPVDREAIEDSETW